MDISSIHLPLMWTFCGGFGWKLGDLYVAIPVAMMLLGIGLVVYSKRAPMTLYLALLVVEIVLIPPLLVAYSSV